MVFDDAFVVVASPENTPMTKDFTQNPNRWWERVNKVRDLVYSEAEKLAAAHPTWGREFAGDLRHIISPYEEESRIAAFIDAECETHNDVTEPEDLWTETGVDGVSDNHFNKLGYQSWKRRYAYSLVDDWGRTLDGLEKADRLPHLRSALDKVHAHIESGNAIPEDQKYGITFHPISAEHELPAHDDWVDHHAYEGVTPNAYGEMSATRYCGAPTQNGESCAYRIVESQDACDLHTTELHELDARHKMLMRSFAPDRYNKEIGIAQQRRGYVPGADVANTDVYADLPLPAKPTPPTASTDYYAPTPPDNQPVVGAGDDAPSSTICGATTGSGGICMRLVKAPGTTCWQHV